METNKLNVVVGVAIEDDGFFFDISASDGMDSEMIRSVLAGGLALSILGEKTPEEQAKAMRDVIEYLESEFINTDSFGDVENNY